MILTIDVLILKELTTKYISRRNKIKLLVDVLPARILRKLNVTAMV